MELALGKMTNWANLSVSKCPYFFFIGQEPLYHYQFLEKDAISLRKLKNHKVISFPWNIHIFNLSVSNKIEETSLIKKKFSAAREY